MARVGEQAICLNAYVDPRATLSFVPFFFLLSLSLSLFAKPHEPLINPHLGRRCQNHNIKLENARRSKSLASPPW
jgi:hypothetical protein